MKTEAVTREENTTNRGNGTLEKGHVRLFSLNPFWRRQTAGSYSLVFNTILNFDNFEYRPEAG